MPEWMVIPDLVPEHPEQRIHTERYEYAASVLNGRAVVDVACGMGYGTELLRAAGSSVLGVDKDPDAIAMAESRYPKCNFVCLDMTQTLFTAQDAIVSFETLEHLYHPELFLANLGPNIKEIIASVPIRPTVGWNPHHRSDHTKDSFREMIRSAGFNIVHELHQMWVDGADLYLMVHGRRA